MDKRDLLCISHLAGEMSHRILRHLDNGTFQSPSGHSTAMLDNYGSLGTKVGVATMIQIPCQNEINQTACYGHEQARPPLPAS